MFTCISSWQAHYKFMCLIFCILEMISVPSQTWARWTKVTVFIRKGFYIRCLYHSIVFCSQVWSTE